MLTQSKQKNIPLYGYPLLKLLVNSIVLLIAFTLTRIYFTINDWTDLRYFSHRDWMIKDMNMAMALVGLAAGLYIAVQAWLAIQYTKGQSKMIRYGMIAVLVAVGVGFAVTGIHASIDDIADGTQSMLET